MSWFRSAAIYLVLTAIILGAVWLFWGKDIETAWKKSRIKSVVEKTAKEIPKQVAQKKADLKKVETPMPTAIPAAVTQLPANAAAEWQKTRSGAAGLVEVQKYENLRDLKALASQQENRMIEILKLVKLYKEPKPAFVPALVPAPQKPAKATVAPKKEKEKPKAALRPMF